LALASYSFAKTSKALMVRSSFASRARHRHCEARPSQYNFVSMGECPDATIGTTPKKQAGSEEMERGAVGRGVLEAPARRFGRGRAYDATCPALCSNALRLRFRRLPHAGTAAHREAGDSHFQEPLTSAQDFCQFCRTRYLAFDVTATSSDTS